MLKMCTPALIYFVMAIVSILVLLVNKVSVTLIMGKVVFVLLWTWLLNFMCKKGFTTASWVLVMSPYVCMLMAFVMGIVKNSETMVPL